MLKIMHDKRLDEKKVSSENIFSGRLLHVFKDTVSLPNGHETTREYILHQGAVAVLPILPNGDMIFVRQFRYPINSVIYEVPAGKLEKDEDHLECAKRELSEETGYTARNWMYLTSIVTTPGFTNETIHLYAASGLERGPQHPDDDEFIDVKAFPEEQVKRMVMNQEIYDSKTLAILYAYMLSKDNYTSL
ncbi:MAG: NUDIX hydrolase [Acidaminococcus sp.]|jgi:ADP-ribose pyrophosphatase|nr:NUDIX hydrolase [Acidaminococcus sp.]MCI2099409.1 NUDIX hydrolase [Acidaminococcus sp.]MCI2113769.1 NUDIX hydrolase [Acidaminococcus sp.]MCI2115657.1 NUDIX hydrolase [Acidaminococcus sp.]